MKVSDVMTNSKRSEAKLIVDGIEIKDVEDVDKRFARQEADVGATLRGGHLFRILKGHGLPEIGSGSGLLDLVGSHLADKDMLFEPGELICSSEKTFANSGADAVYFLDVDLRGVAEDFAHIYACPTVADSLTRSRLGLSKWEVCPAFNDIHCEQAPSPWVATFRQIAEFMGCPHTDVAAANLIFARSKRFRAIKTRWEQVLDCLGAHKLIVDAIKPGLLWVTGENFDIVRDLYVLTEIEWRQSRDGGLQFGRGRIEFCDRWMDFAFTPSLSSWNARDEDYQAMLRWAFPGRKQLEPVIPD